MRAKRIDWLAILVALTAVAPSSRSFAQYCAYVGSDNTRYMSVIDTASRTVTAAIPLPGTGHTVAITPNGRTAYVANDQNIFVIDTSSGTLTRTLFFGGDVAASPDGQHLYVVSPQGTLSQITTATNEVTAVVPYPIGRFDQSFHALSFSPMGDLVYALVNALPAHPPHPPADVAVVNAKSNLIVYTVALPRTSGFDVSTTAIAVNPSGADAYVTDFYSTDVSIIDTAAYGLSGNVVSLPGNDIDDVVFTPNGQRAYMIDDAHTVYAVDTARRSVLATITLGEGDQTDGGHMAVTPDGDFVYATGFVAGAVFVIDTSTNTLATTIQLEKGLEGIAIATLPKGCVGPPPPPTSTPTPTATPTPGTCVGDCDGSGDVQINEIITCVNIALGSEPLSTCTACDENGDGQVEINEIITAVKNALNGCP